MTHDADETVLTGGSVNVVVRVGDTVRRPWHRWTPGTQLLLRHLEEVGFTQAPTVLGVDERGREVLSWIDGEPALRPWPQALRSESGLGALTQVVRDLHDAVATFRPPAGTEWCIGPRPLEDGEIVLHGDLAPWNTIWSQGRPVGILDWDFAEPGPPLLDVACLAYFSVPLGGEAMCRDSGLPADADVGRRLRVVCDVYGVDDVGALLDMVEHFWERDVERITDLGAHGVVPWDGFLRRGLHTEGAQRLEWFRAHRSALD